VDDLDGAGAVGPVASADHGGAFDAAPDLPFHLVVAPSRGRFLPSIEGGEVRAGDVLGYVAGGNGFHEPVIARVGGTVHRALRFALQPVDPGTCLYWLD
jgi:hypothetical protein